MLTADGSIRLTAVLANLSRRPRPTAGRSRKPLVNFDPPLDDLDLYLDVSDPPPQDDLVVFEVHLIDILTNPWTSSIHTWTIPTHPWTIPT